ncbi:MAG TPA: hypothetical protein VM492_07015 [Sumerlaeia bacterium]|nr:hypothetical protein [Sumerlaeia bacterium]
MIPFVTLCASEPSAFAAAAAAFTVEADFLGDGTWCVYDDLEAPAGRTATHVFPDGCSAHWVRLTADCPCRASVILTYDWSLA